MRSSAAWSCGHAIAAKTPEHIAGEAFTVQSDEHRIRTIHGAQGHRHMIESRLLLVEHTRITNSP